MLFVFITSLNKYYSIYHYIDINRNILLDGYVFYLTIVVCSTAQMAQDIGENGTVYRGRSRTPTLPRFEKF